jgi:hypothetical protein
MSPYLLLFLIPGVVLIAIVGVNLFRPQPRPRRATLPDYQRLSSEPRKYPGSGAAVGTGPIYPAGYSNDGAWILQDSHSGDVSSSFCDSGSSDSGGGDGGGCD